MTEPEVPPLLKPEVYQRDGAGAALQFPSLVGGECQCGYVFFPWQGYGCEMCGSFGEDLSRRALQGTGKLMGVARVHLHAGGREAPFTVVSVKLDDGPVVRTLYTGALPKIGERVVTTLEAVPHPETGETCLDLRFVAADMGAAG